MSSEASTNFATLSALVKEQCCRQWQVDIEHAEANRFTDPAVMDILGAQPVSQNEQNPAEEMGKPASKVEQWIQIAIDIEEDQFVCFVHIDGRC